MIAVDTSAMSAFLAGARGADCDLIEESLATGAVVLPPVVCTELLSAPLLTAEAAGLFRALPLVPLLEGYWARAGGLRAAILKRGWKARLGDALVAQACIDHGLPLVTRDRDFRHYARAARLKLLP
ncbi:MAG: PIN domain-containing protein [Myxococcales bacterium]|nr:PIN domain-containing protein [Myxococcales bacterium]